MKQLSILLTLILFSFNVYANKIDNLGAGLSYKEVSSHLAQIEKQTKAKEPNIDNLVSEISYLTETNIKIDEARKIIEGEIKIIEKRIEALGVIDENLPEAKIIAQKRQEFNQELSNEKTRLSEIDILSTKIDELNQRIFDIRNQMLWGNLLKSDWGFFDFPTLLKVNGELLELGFDIVKSPYDWYSNLSAKQKDIVHDNIIIVVLVIAFITCIGYLLRRFIIRRWGYRADIESPRLGRKLVASITVWFAYGIIPTAIISFCWYWVVNAELMKASFLGLVLPSLLYYLLYVIIGRASCRVVFTPYNEKWRLIKMPTDKAKKMTRSIYFTIAVFGVFAFLQHIVTTYDYPLELLSYILAIASMVKAFCVVWIAHVYFASEQVEVINEDDEEEIAEQEKNTFRIGMLISLFALSIIGMSLLGYARLASFIVNRAVLSAIVIGVFSIIRQFLYDFIQRILLMGVWVNTFRMRRIFLRKIDFWFGIVAEPILFLLLVGGLLLLWGVPFDVLQATAYKAFSGFTIGGIEISLLSIFMGILIFVICLWLIKFIRHRIEFKLLEKTSIDSGTKHSLASGFAYIGYVLAALLAIAVMGGNLTNIALIAGALSVGIGLGLQDVVNNFVSGIIMLIERPLKVGDWVVIGNDEGEVKQINIRSTEVQTFNRASVIIPNSQVLSNSVVNRTHQNNWARYAVKVGVAYGSDVDRVKDILLESAISHPKVAKKPAPYVLFQDFGESSLDFELRFYVSDINVGWTAPSDVRFIINRRFKEEGIEIPFRQMVIHQGSQIADRTEAQFYAKKRKSNKNVD